MGGDLSFIVPVCRGRQNRLSFLGDGLCSAAFVLGLLHHSVLSASLNIASGLWTQFLMRRASVLLLWQVLLINKTTTLDHS